MKSEKSAIETYKYFSTLEGNQHIASEFALKTILKIISIHKPKKILELGLGIGSISYSVLKFFKTEKQQIDYFGTEMNEFCLNAISKYLKIYYSELKVFNSLIDVPTNQKFDLVIIDGSDENIINIKQSMTKNGIIIVEGDRIPQLNIIRSIFPKSIYTRVISDYKNPSYGPFSANDYSSGLQLIFINPNFKQKLDYSKFKVKTAINYKIRAFKK